MMSGTLYLCATPIGNLEDVTYRVVKTLGEVDLIAAEDTRHSRKLLNHYGIKTPVTSYHEHNKHRKAEFLVSQLLDGKNIALITDAGTPAISDPGEELVRQAYKAGITITSLPGPCALVTALTLSGLSTQRFAFEAFLPSEKKERDRILEDLVCETRTIILYEAPHRLKKTLAELLEALGDRPVAIVRELTKIHETVLRTSLEEAVKIYENTEPRGEYVLVIEGKTQNEIDRQKQSRWEETGIKEHMNIYLNRGMDKKDAMKAVAKDRGITKRQVYEALIDAKDGDDS